VFDCALIAFGGAVEEGGGVWGGCGGGGGGGAGGFGEAGAGAGGWDCGCLGGGSVDELWGVGKGSGPLSGGIAMGWGLCAWKRVSEDVDGDPTLWQGDMAEVRRLC